MIPQRLDSDTDCDETVTVVVEPTIEESTKIPTVVEPVDELFVVIFLPFIATRFDPEPNFTNSDTSAFAICSDPFFHVTVAEA